MIWNDVYSKPIFISRYTLFNTKSNTSKNNSYIPEWHYNNDKNYIRVWGGKKIIQTCSDEGASRHLNHLNPPLKLHRLLRSSGARNPGPFLLLLDWLSGELQNQEVSCCAQSGERVKGRILVNCIAVEPHLTDTPQQWTPTTNKSQLSSHSLQLKQPLNSGYPATAYNKQLWQSQLYANNN